MSESRYRWQQLADQIRNGIAAGSPPVGQLLPSVRSLMDVHGVSDNTVTRAIAVLAAEGLVRGEQGVGVRVIAAAAAPAKSTEDRLMEMEARLAEHAERLARLENPPAE